MIQFITQNNLDISQFNIITPIPLHAARFRERGYNQSELLAKIIAQKYQIPLIPNLLKRCYNTPSQTLLSQKDRWTNISDAFRINDSRDIRDQNILIIDDLLTTGATASEAALVLKKHGAPKVGILTLAIVEETH